MMYIYQLFAWICCSATVVAVSGQFVFPSQNVTLGNLVIDNNTGDIFVGAVNYIYKLSENLTKLNEVYTECNWTNLSTNANQLLIIEHLSGTRKLFGCGSCHYGTCFTYDMKSFSYTLLDDLYNIVSNYANESAVGVEDPVNKGILVASTRRIGYVFDYSFLKYGNCGEYPGCFERRPSRKFNPQRQVTNYVLAAIIGKYRYFFGYGYEYQESNVVRLCEFIGHTETLVSNVEMPLKCVAEDGTDFKQLTAATVVRVSGKVAENFGSTGNEDDAIIVGVFQSSKNSLLSAVCTYTVQQINKFFSKNIVKCLKSEKEDKIVRDKYNKNEMTNKCVKDRLTNCSDEASQNKNIVGTISLDSQALVTCHDCGVVSSMDTTVYQGNIIAFVGAQSGTLSKFVLSSNVMGYRYETSYRIPGSEILSVNFDLSAKSAYLLSPHKLLQIPVEECDNRTTCESCVKDKDPYCGWCTLYAKCTTYDKCPNFGIDRLGYVRQANKCINISSIDPPSIPLSDTLIQKVNVSIVNLPVRQKGSYWCSVNNIKMPSILIGNLMECSVPTSSKLPEPSSDTGLVKAEVAVHWNETNGKITSAMLELYKCSAISSCMMCTTGLLRCSWCYYTAECSADPISTCPQSYAPWVQNPSQHECPHLNAQELYIPASVEREVVVTGTRLPKPGSSQDERYACTVSAGDQMFSIPATWNSSTNITCGLQQYKYRGSSVEISGNLTVKLGKSDVKADGEVQVYLYECRRTAKQCGSCVVSKKEYNCGWCTNTSKCSVQDVCRSELWVRPAGECPGSPRIKKFSPKTGHILGNTRLQLDGEEFGRKFADVEKVSVAGLPCKTVEDDYIIAQRIVCLTNSSSKSLSGKINVVVSGKVGQSDDKFHYQNPQVEDYKPKIGPFSGGTYMTIYGQELDTGDFSKIQVSLGQSRCLNLSVTKTKLTCTTSKFINKARKRRSNDKQLVVKFNGHPPKYGANVTVFQYVPDPNITYITPRFIFPSSFQEIDVTGTNLNGIHFPKIKLSFESKPSIEGDCEKPSFDAMICPLPELNEELRNYLNKSGDSKVVDGLKGKISLTLDGVTKWQDLRSYPQFNSITIVPDPVIYQFPGIHVLKTRTLEIEGRNFRVKGVENLIDLYLITVGGQKCNITSVAQKIIFCNAPDRKSLAKVATYDVLVNVSSSSINVNVGKLKYDIGVSEGSATDMELIYIIVGVCGGVFLIFVVLMCCLYRRKKRQQEQNERTYEMQMNSLESKVAKECREAFAELQTDMTDFTSDLGDAGIHFFDFKNYAMRVLFPGVQLHVVMEEKMAQESPKWDEALRTFSQLIGNKNFLLIFVKTLESQSQFKMQDRCNVASLLVIALQSKMDYCTDILQHLLSELIRKSMSKSHPKLLLRRTECIAEKLLTNWLTFTLSNFIKDKAGKPLFMLYKAIRFQVEKGPVDVITNEARYSLSEDKLLRQSIEYNKLTVTVEFEHDPPVQVELLDTDTIEQAKEKIMELLFKNVPFSCRIPKDELTLKWVECPSKHTILKDEDATTVREGEWKRLNTLGHYQVPDGTCLRLVKRFAQAFDTSELNTSVSKISYSPSLHSNASLMFSSKQNITDAERKPWHLTKHVDSYAQEKSDPRHSKLLSEIYLTRLLSTKGTLQQYVDDMFDCIFASFRKNERPPLPIKFLFDFLDDQARELNITDPEVLHTWKNNSLPLRFWVNLIKNPNFLFDVYKAPIVDSCLSVIAQLFMDACSVSDHVLGKDSPSNKLLYAKEIPTYRQKVERFYNDVANAPKLTDEEVKDFFATHYIEDFNVDQALKELYKYAAKYQDELQEALEDARYPQLASKLEHVVAIFSDD